MNDEKNIKLKKAPLIEKIASISAILIAIVLVSIGFYWIMDSDQELPAGAAILVVGSLMSLIVVLKNVAENKKKSSSNNKLISPEIVTGFSISLVGILWHFFI